MADTPFLSVDKTLSGDTIPVQSKPGSDDNEWILYIPQRSSITGAIPLDCFVSSTGHLLSWGVLPLC